MRNALFALLLGALAPAWTATAARLDRPDAAGDTIALLEKISSGDADRLAVLVERMRELVAAYPRTWIEAYQWLELAADPFATGAQPNGPYGRP